MSTFYIIVCFPNKPLWSLMRPQHDLCDLSHQSPIRIQIPLWNSNFWWKSTTSYGAFQISLLLFLGLCAFSHNLDGCFLALPASTARGSVLVYNVTKLHSHCEVSKFICPVFSLNISFSTRAKTILFPSILIQGYWNWFLWPFTLYKYHLHIVFIFETTDRCSPKTIGGNGSFPWWYILGNSIRARDHHPSLHGCWWD